MNEEDAVGAFVDDRQLGVIDEHAQGLTRRRPKDGAEAGRHERAQGLGLLPEGSKIGEGEAEAEGAAGFEVGPFCPHTRGQQPMHHMPEGAGVELLEIDGVEMHEPS